MQRAKEKRTFALVLFSIYRGKDMMDKDIIDKYKNPHERGFRYEMLRSLIKTIMYKPFLTYHDYSKHLYYWDVVRMVLFEYRIRQYLVVHRKRHGKFMESEREFVFKGDWTKGMPEDVAEDFKKPPPEKKSKKKKRKPNKIAYKLNTRTYSSMSRTRRNKGGGAHRDLNPKKVNKKIGVEPVDNFLWWENRFPRFMIYTFLMSLRLKDPSGKMLYQQDEFKGYFNGTEELYEACINAGK